MKLTDQIKEKIERADSKEKKQDILNDVKNKVMDAGVILDDSELEQVSGGGLPPLDQIRKGDPGENGQ